MNPRRSDAPIKTSDRGCLDLSTESCTKYPIYYCRVTQFEVEGSETSDRDSFHLMREGVEVFVVVVVPHVCGVTSSILDEADKDIIRRSPLTEVHVRRKAA
jgi:hypothetical protein